MDETMAQGDGYIPRIKEKYLQETVPHLVDVFSYKNRMEVPVLEKITVNIGVGETIQNDRALKSAVDELMQITGQKPIITKAKKSISNFKLRQGMAIGCKVTLRGERMYEFLDRLVSTAIPRIRDFRGISDKGFDGRGNFNLGLREQIVFPEIDYDKVESVRGMDIAFVTSAKTDKEGFELLRGLGIPFRTT